MKKSWSKRSVDRKIPRRPLKQIIGQRHHEVATPNLLPKRWILLLRNDSDWSTIQKRFYNDKFEGLFRDPRPSLNLDRAHKWIPALCFLNVIDDTFARSHPSPINCYRPMRRLDFAGLTNERWFEIILIGAQVARVGVRLWQPLANQSLNDLPPNQAPDGRGQSYFIDLLIYSFLPLRPPIKLLPNWSLLCQEFKRATKQHWIPSLYLSLN